MDAPNVRYTGSFDEARIAYASLGDEFRNHSDATLKGFAEPVALYEVGN